MCSNFTILQAYRQYLGAAGRTRGTIEVRVSHIRRLIPLGNFTDISAHQIIEWLAEGCWAPTTRRSIRSSFCVFFTWLQKEGYRLDNPAARLPRVRPPRALPRPASESTVISAMRKAPPRVALMIEIMAKCGLRRGEVCKIHSKDVRRSGCDRLLRVSGKGGHQREIPLPPHIARVILDAQGYLFPGQISGHLAAATVGKLISRYLPTGVTPHALRHRYGTEVYSRSHDIRATQVLLGHARLDTTAIYVAVSDVARAQAAAKAWKISA